MASRKPVTPRKQPRQVRSQATYAAILEAAAQLLSEKGYAAVTTNHIAERAGVSIGSLYQYFPNKDTICVDLLQRHISEGQTRIKQLFTERLTVHAGLDEMLKCLIEAALDHHAHDPRLHKVLEEEVPHPPHIRQATRANEELYADMLAQWIRLQQPKRKTDPSVAADLVIYTIKALTHWYVLHRSHEVDRDVFFTELACMVRSYLDVPPAPPAG